MSITAIVANDTIKLPLHVADGTRVEVRLLGEPGVHEPTSSTRLQLFRDLQREVALTPEAASDWIARVADGRR